MMSVPLALKPLHVPFRQNMPEHAYRIFLSKLGKPSHGHYILKQMVFKSSSVFPLSTVRCQMRPDPLRTQRPMLKLPTYECILLSQTKSQKPLLAVGYI